MNDTAKKIGLDKATNFSVSHGMHHDYNYSTAFAIATISHFVMQMQPVFREIVDCKKYECVSRIQPGHKYEWENTNSMLWESSRCYHGIKTGVTLTAGPSLAVNYRDQGG